MDGTLDPFEGFVFDDAVECFVGEGEALGVADGGGEVGVGGAPAAFAFEADAVGDVEVAGDLEEAAVAGTDVEEAGGRRAGAWGLSWRRLENRPRLVLSGPVA